jgi:ribonuclease VapC
MSTFVPDPPVGVNVILDASAILAFLQGEPGAEHVDEAIATGGAAISAVNLAEVLSKITDRGQDPTPTLQEVASVVAVLPFTTEQALASAEIRKITTGIDLGIADRACLAVALTTRLPVLTSDQVWAELDALPIEVRPIR